MSNVNVVVIAGHMTRDPEVRFTASGTCVMSFGIAVSESRKNNQTGEWENRPNFVDCTMFGKRAETLANILKKGMKLTVRGRLRWEKWEKDGQNRSRLYVVADEIELPPANRGDGENKNFQPQYQKDEYDPYVYDEDIPF